MKKFVLITSQRTGSTLFVRTLDQHTQISMAGEIFHYGLGIHQADRQFPFIRSSKFSKKVGYYLNFPFLAIYYKLFLNNFFKSRLEGVDAVGFKLMISQLRFLPFGLSYLKRKGIKPIVLIRKDAVGCALSSLVASKTGFYHHFQKSESLGKKTQFILDFKDLQKRIKRVEKNNTKLLKISKFFPENLVLYYEDFENFNQVTEKVCRYLGISIMEVKPIMKKLGSRDKYYDTIINFPEIVRKLNEIGYHYD